MAEIFHAVSSPEARRQADLMGAFVAGWGLTPVCIRRRFGLDMPRARRQPGIPTRPGPDELMSTFYPLFYGAGLRDYAPAI